MVHFTLEQLYAWMGQFLWPMLRISSFLMVAPFFRDAAIPSNIKVGLALVVSLAMAPSVVVPQGVAISSYEGLAIALTQIVIGITLAFTLRLVFAAVLLAAELIGLQMGLSFAQFFDPSTGGSTNVLGRFMNVIALLVFITANGHLFVIAGLYYTFDLLPINGQFIAMDGLGALLEFATVIFTAGILMALPMIIALLTVNLCMGILNRTAQQLSIFSVGFPITVTLGFGLLLVVLPYSASFLLDLFEQGYQAMSEVTLKMGR